MNKKVKNVLMVTVLIISVSYLLQDFLLWKNLYPLAYRDLVWENSDKFEVDPYLTLAIMRIESKFNPEAISKKGARGLMQLMPETANWIGKQNNLVIEDEDLFKPDVNIPLGTWYLNHLIKQFGEEVIAIAAYNAGQGNVHRWLEEGTWDGTIEDVQNIPFSETRSYLMRVKVAWWKYKDIYGK